MNAKKSSFLIAFALALCMATAINMSGEKNSSPFFLVEDNIALADTGTCQRLPYNSCYLGGGGYRGYVRMPDPNCCPPNE